MSGALLEVERLGKAYPASADARFRLGAFVRILGGRAFARRSVLGDVSFAVQPGESLAIIGENGAGKSTLLKLICGVLHPSTGRIQRRGSLGALLELGAGFDPECTGRENVHLAATLMGQPAAAVRDKLDDVLAFADIGRYIDEPVKHYSSGMVVRLGFAVIASVRPQLLVTDEVLAVGDESFQKKCIRWIEDYLDSGGTLLLVAHSMYHVQKLCKHALWLRDGKMAAYGDAFEVSQDYLAYHERKTAIESAPARIAGVHEYHVARVLLNERDGEAPLALPFGSELRVRARIGSGDGRIPKLAIGLVRVDGTAVYGVSNEIDGAGPCLVEADAVEYAVDFAALPLLPGSYTLRLFAMDPEGLRVFDTVERSLVIRGALRELGSVRLAHRWHGPGGG